MDEYDESSIEMMPVEEDMNGPEEALRVERVGKLTYLIDTVIVKRVPYELSKYIQVQVSDDLSEKSTGIFTTGIDVFSKEEKLKMEERAKRFGLTEKSKESLCNYEEDLYSR